MNWTFHPTNKEITTSLPLSVEVRNWKGRPRVILDGVGDLELKGTPQGAMKADFYLTLPGTYKVTIQDSGSKDFYQFQVKQHHYLDFSNEFGFFFILFLFVMGGIVLWVRQIMKKKTPAT